MTKIKKTDSVGNGPEPAGSTVEPEAIEQNEGDYDDAAEAAYEEGPSVLEALTSFGKQDADQAFVQEAVEQVNAIYRRNVDNGKLEIGGYLLDKIFGGNIEAAMSTNPYKSATFSQVARSPRLLVESKTLGSWVRAAAVNRDFTAKGLSFPQLTTYHLVELAKVKDEARRIEIATDADEKDLTVKELRKLISEENGTGQNASDKIKQEVQKAMKGLSDLSVSEDVLAFVEDLEAIKQVYSPGKALDLIPEVYASLEAVQGAAEVLETFANNLDEIVNETRKRRSA